MKAARHGHSLNRKKTINVYKFYLPDKTSYIANKKAKLMRLQSGSSHAVSNSQPRIQSTIFKTEIPDKNYATKSFESSRIRANSSNKIARSGNVSAHRM
jgi:hypothetical protein